jgi:DNA-binding LacI/PurR family transcriptional regulator
MAGDDSGDGADDRLPCTLGPRRDARAGVAVTMALLQRSNEEASETPEHVTMRVISEQRTGYLQVEHLANAGHRRIGYALPDNPRLHDLATLRLEGAREACADLGLPEPVTVAMPLTVEGGATAVSKWRRVDPPVTGVCAYNDEWAMAVLAGMRVLGLSAPAALAVVGVDDIPAAALAAPPLTTVTSDMRAIAKHVADSVVCSLSGGEPPPRADVDHVRIVVRESAP